MIHIFEDITAKIKANVPGIKWIDIDEGQFELFGENAPVDYPCLLIGFPQASYQQNGYLNQVADMTVSIRVAFRVFEKLNGDVPTQFKDEALAHYNILQDVMKCIHGMKSEHYGHLIRTSWAKDQSIDPKIYNVDFSCTMSDASLENDYDEYVVQEQFQIPKP